MPIRIDLTGQRYGRWTVECLSRAEPKHNYWSCLCDCGIRKIVAGNSLRAGSSKSCGCLMRERTSVANRTHGETLGRHASSEYLIWRNMRDRCYNPNVRGFKNYGGRGVTICDEWRESFDQFLADMGRRPDGLSLERKDNDGPYCKANCVWTTRSEQNSNRRNNITVLLDGQQIHVAEAARRLGMLPHVIYHRIDRGWPESRWLEPQRLSAAQRLRATPREGPG